MHSIDIKVRPIMAVSPTVILDLESCAAPLYFKLSGKFLLRLSAERPEHGVPQLAVVLATEMHIM
jgi:hypothetical protein